MYDHVTALMNPLCHNIYTFINEWVNITVDTIRATQDDKDTYRF